MNGVHDLGGMEGLGPVPIEENEPVFHDDWERTAFKLTLATMAAGYYHVDEVRATIEHIPAPDYLAAKYYEKWAWVLEEMMKRRGVVSEDEIDAGKSLHEGQGNPAVPVEMMQAAMTQRFPTDVEVDAKPVFAAGDTVRAKNMHPHCHTRTPRYVRGHLGKVLEVHEAYKLPDTNAHGNPDVAEYCYTVQFGARELWGEDAPAKDSVLLTMFESYLEPA